MDPRKPAEGETPDIVEEVSETTDPNETEGVQPGETPDTDETPPDDDSPLHKALKAERQSVKDLKASSADLVKSNTELTKRISEFEAADLERKTNDLVIGHKLNDQQARAISKLKTFEDRQEFANAFSPVHRTIAGTSRRSDRGERLEKAGLMPEASKQIMDEINGFNMDHPYHDLSAEDQEIYIIRRAKQRGLLLAGKKTTPVY